MKLSTKLKMGAGALAIAAVAAASAQAATGTYNLGVTFVDPFTITEATPATFGQLVAEVNTTYSMTAASVVTPGAGGAVVGGTPAAGSFTLVDSSAGAAVDVTVDAPVAGPNGFLTINQFNCDYNTGTAATGATCAYDAAANPGAGTTLLVGFDITVAGSPPDAATDTATYDVTIVFD